MFHGEVDSQATFGGDSGSAARFFYTAKASRRERGEYCTHPTVKPLALMRYLCRLVTPPDGLVLDPFTGSGTTGIAAILEGFRFIGIEQDAAHVALAERRIKEWTELPIEAEAAV
jgi:DNA modification methylase